jgi:hypothetical protein
MDSGGLTELHEGRRRWWVGYDELHEGRRWRWVGYDKLPGWRTAAASSSTREHRVGRSGEALLVGIFFFFSFSLSSL